MAGKPWTRDEPHFNLGRRRVMQGKIPPELARVTPEQAAWAAGLFEGEGSVFVERRDHVSRGGEQRRYSTVRMSVNSTDRDVIDRIHDLLGGTVSFMPQHRKLNRKDQWKWTLYGYEAAVIVLDLFRPWLLARRLAKFEETLADVAEYRAGVHRLPSRS